MFENYYSFFHYCLFSCPYVMLHKSILNEPKSGVHKQSLRGDDAPGHTVATVTLARASERKFSRGVRSRGGVEDTKLEAKDTKKIRGQGQGQPFRGKTLSRPRTGMLEATDQGHKRKCSPKKNKVFKNFFQALSSKKRLLKFFFRRSTKFQQFKKKVLSSSRGFSRTWGLEAKAKNLTFEAKDFKMCPRGQERPWGLHLWYEGRYRAPKSLWAPNQRLIFFFWFFAQN